MARRFPLILDRLAGGDVTLTAIGLLASHLTPDNHRELLDAARHKSKREVEHLIATLRPQAPIASSVRKLPSPVRPSIASDAGQPREMAPVADQSLEPPVAIPVPPASARPRPAVIRPLGPERYKVQFTASAETFEKLRRAQDLMRHRVPDGDVAAIFDLALTLLLEYLDRTKLAAAQHPRASRGTAPGSRGIPAAVRRRVWTRDEGRCSFVGTYGRCTEHGFLEFRHVVPYAAGGKAAADNIELRCRAHNQYEADKYFTGRSQPAYGNAPNCPG